MKSDPSRIGIIDIGSNSVRLVVFDVSTRAPTYYYNEKVMCALASDLLETGCLSPSGKKRAIRAIQRFKALATHMDIPVHTIATAAMRDAQDGQAFQNDIFAATGLAVTIISGPQEARLAALGVCLGTQNATGLVTDLGGGSLEICPVDNGQVRTGVSLPYGVLRVTLDILEALPETLRSVDLLREAPTEQTLYLVGGSWRAIAKVHMARTKYPMPVVNDYVLTRLDAQETIGWILACESLDAIPAKLSKARLAALQPAAQILQALIDAIVPETIQFSALGVREGLLSEILSMTPAADTDDEDPFVTSCRFIEAKRARCPGFGDELFTWIEAFLHTLPCDTSPMRHRLHAACLLSDVSWRMHPDYRAQSCFETATRTYLTGVAHSDRIWIGAALLHRHKGGRKILTKTSACQSLDDDDQQFAMIAGQAMRLGIVLAGAQQGILAATQLDYTRETGVTLTLSPENATLQGENVEKYLNALSETTVSYMSETHPLPV